MGWVASIPRSYCKKLKPLCAAASNWTGGSTTQLIDEIGSTVNIYGTGLTLSNVTPTSWGSEGYLSGVLADGTVLTDVQFYLTSDSKLNVMSAAPEPSTIPPVVTAISLGLGFAWRRHRAKLAA